jgi:VanZ family protein
LGNRIYFFSRESRFLILGVVWSVVILFLTLSPKAPNSVPFINIPHFDKLGHFGLFFILAIFVHLALRPKTGSLRWIILIGYCAFLGVMTEYLQTKIEGRSGDVLDFLADIAGSLSGALIISRINFQRSDAF